MLFIVYNNKDGLERASRLFPIRTGVAVPDWIIVGDKMDKFGAGGVKGAGWVILDRRLQASLILLSSVWGLDWKLNTSMSWQDWWSQPYTKLQKSGSVFSQDLLAMQYTWTIAVAGKHGYVSTVRSLSFFHWISLLLYDSSIWQTLPHTTSWTYILDHEKYNKTANVSVQDVLSLVEDVPIGVRKKSYSSEILWKARLVYSRGQTRSTSPISQLPGNISAIFLKKIVQLDEILSLAQTSVGPFFRCGGISPHPSE